MLSQGKTRLTSPATMYRIYGQRPFKSTTYFEFSESRGEGATAWSVKDSESAGILFKNVACCPHHLKYLFGNKLTRDKDPDPALMTENRHHISSVPIQQQYIVFLDSSFQQGSEGSNSSSTARLLSSSILPAL